MCVHISSVSLHVFLLTGIASHHEKHRLLHQESDSQSKVSTRVSQVRVNSDKRGPDRPTVERSHFENNEDEKQEVKILEYMQQRGDKNSMQKIDLKEVIDS